MRSTNSLHHAYTAPEIAQLGRASDLTLGQLYQPHMDGCNCSKANSDDDDLIGC